MANQTIVGQFIHGQEIFNETAERFETINPATEEVIALVEQATDAQIDAAVESATKAQKIWASYPPVERGRIIMKAVNLLRERNLELAKLETNDTGKPLSETESVDIVTGADVLEYYAGLADAIEGTQLPLRDDSFFYTRREPLGVVAGIGAWNYPIQIAMWKSAPALVSGNAMIFKPSEVTPLSTMKLAEIFVEAGVPEGVFNVVQGDYRVGAALSNHSGITKISFTGSVPTGKKVMEGASHSLKEITMELGGKSPLIIFEDADLDRAADIAMMANFYSTGQVCTNGTRVFIHESIKSTFEEKLLERIQNVRLGDPTHPETNFGPLVSKPHFEKVMRYIEQGEAEGARLLAGGKRAAETGYFVEATIFTDCTDEMAIVQDEIFGPVMSILSFSDEASVIQRANATEYGLAAGIVTNDLTRAHRVIHQIEAGICWINTWGESAAQMPVGGYKASGIGRENGLETLKAYTQTKSIQIELGAFESVF